MDNNDNASAYTPNLPPSSSAERDAIYTATQEAIKSRNMKHAHNLLLKLIQVDGNNPELWLLLAWTAPSKSEAGVFFEHLLQIQPDYPLAICGVAWSGVEWSPEGGVRLEESQTEEKPFDAVAPPTSEQPKKSLARQTGELVASVASLVSKPLRRKTGELKPADEIDDHTIEEEHPGEISPTASLEEDKSLSGWKVDLPPVVASTASKSRSEWGRGFDQPEAVANQISPGKQVEWLEPAAWSMEQDAQDYPLVEERGSGARARSKPLSVGLSGISLAVFFGLYLLGIASAELVTAYRSPILGQAYHGVLFILILMFAIFNPGSKQKTLLFVLGLVPLMRLVSLTMPLVGLDFPGAYVAIGIILLIVAFLILHLAGIKPSQVGLISGKFLMLQLVFGTVGIGIGFIEYLILRPEPMASSFSFLSILVPALVLFVFPGFTEEFLFRGLMQHASSGINKSVGFLYIALLYAVLHIGYKSWLDLIFIFLVGLLFSVLVEKTRSIVGVTMAHGLASICLFLVFPFVLAIPGQKLSFLSAPMAEVTGPAIWSAPFGDASRQVEIILPASTPTPTITPSTIEASSTPAPALTLAPTWTPSITWTSTPSPTLTITPTFTRTPTAVSTSTSTPRPTLRFTSTPTRTATSVPLPTLTPTVIPSPTLTPYLSPTPTPTKTPIPTDVLPTEVPTNTPTPT